MATSINSGDTAWILTSTALVLFMTIPALGLFYGGLVRAKNILSVLMHCTAIAAMASILWLVVGYSIAFTPGTALFGGLSKAFLLSVDRTTVWPDTGLPETVFFMFQMTFAIITPALIVGAYVERIRFAAVLLFSALWLLVVYAPVTHWVWGGGWLSDLGAMDFAGGIVVHVTAGVSALVIAKMLGPRDGFPDHVHPPHAPWMVMIGAAMTQGNVLMKNCPLDYLDALVVKLREAGASIAEEDEGVRVMGKWPIKSVDVKTMPYPGFPTDMQAQIMAMMTIAGGLSVIRETVFENRFMHVGELRRMGADISVDGRCAIIRGVPGLSGAPLMATDLRASASLVLAGLVASGRTEVSRIYHLDRGYDGLEKKLAALGAEIKRVHDKDE